MREIRVKLIERIKRAPGVESFRFALKERLDFIAGQFLQVIFNEVNKDNKELNKYLSFSSSPTKEYIEFTKRLSDSEFSQRLKNLKAGDEVLIKAPLGNCVFKEEYKKIGFLIGGIGITPVISIIEYIVDKKLDTDVVLLYSNRIEEDIAFRKELDYWQSMNKNIKVIYTVTECEPKGSSCVFGRIDKNLFIRETDDYEKRVIFIFGPPKMVEAMKSICLDTGCKGENIKTESFFGY